MLTCSIHEHWYSISRRNSIYRRRLRRVSAAPTNNFPKQSAGTVWAFHHPVNSSSYHSRVYHSPYPFWIKCSCTSDSTRSTSSHLPKTCLQQWIQEIYSMYSIAAMNQAKLLRTQVPAPSRFEHVFLNSHSVFLCVANELQWFTPWTWPVAAPASDTLSGP